MHNKLLIAIMTCATLVIGAYFVTELKKAVSPQIFSTLVGAIFGYAMMGVGIYLLFILILVLISTFGGG